MPNEAPGFREIPFNYTSADDERIVSLLLGPGAWETIGELRGRRVTGRSARLLMRVLGELFLHRRNAYLLEELVTSPKRQARLFSGLEADLSAIEEKAGGEPRVARILEGTREVVARFEADVRETPALRNRVRRALAPHVGGANVLFDPFTLVAHATDATDWRLHLPLAVVRPPEEAAVAPLLSAIASLGLHAIPRGAGTGLTGGAVPLRARCVDQQAALAGAGCVRRGLIKATYGTGVFVLAHAGDERPSPSGGLLPTLAWKVNGRVEWAIDGGVFTAGALLEWLSRDLGLAADPPALAAAAATVEDSGAVKVLPALAGVGAPWWKPEARAVIAGLSGSARPAHIARAALDGIAWRVADIVSVVQESVPVQVLRVDGGLTRDPTLLQLQADAAGVAVQRGLLDATAAGAAALAAVGAGVWSSTLEIEERIPSGDRFAPRRDARWRAAAHAEWRGFVERAAAL